jgi:hypothetical protein
VSEALELVKVLVRPGWATEIEHPPLNEQEIEDAIEVADGAFTRVFVLEAQWLPVV